ncbi:M20 family metallo-hydrolase [Lachnospiraceae bacterium 62-35]
MKVNKNRLWNYLQEIGSIGADPRGGISRLSWTPAYKEACIRLTTFMEKIGLKVHMDAVGNLFGKLEGTDPSLSPILTGSHLDTKPMGGYFDGNAGIIAPLECLTAMHEAGFHPRRSIEIAAFVNEEATEFLGGCFGSRAITGQLDKQYLLTCKDRTTGQTMYDALKEFGMGCNPDQFENCILKKEDYYCFLELHIEQGRGLLDCGKPISILHGIAGIKEFYITIHGVRAHAGGMAMKDRHDAMAAAAQIGCMVEHLALNGGKATRGTCGFIHSQPAEVSIIADTAIVAVDFREMDPDIFEQLYIDLLAFTKKECEKRGLTFTVKMDLDAEPVICDVRLQKLMLEAAVQHQIPHMQSISYPAHDAHHLSLLYPVGMIFLRSSNEGVSHCPEEYTTPEDLEAGTIVLLDTLKKLSAEDIL